MSRGLVLVEPATAIVVGFPAFWKARHLVLIVAFLIKRSVLLRRDGGHDCLGRDSTRLDLEDEALEDARCPGTVEGEVQLNSTATNHWIQVTSGNGSGGWEHKGGATVADRREYIRL